MKRFIRSMCVAGLAMICAVVLLCNTALFRAKAETAQSVAVAQTERLLHQKSKIYSSANSPDYFAGCDDTADYKYESAEMTILTHGLQSDASVWSNSGVLNAATEFVYYKNSIIEKIRKKTDIDLYLADCKNVTTDSEKERGFRLCKVDLADYKNLTATEYIEDISKHIVVVYQSAVAEEENTVVYEEFHNVVDTLSLQYKTLSGKLPVLNLIGHSRGGLTNIEYATEHPYNVTSVCSMGTPYNGSVLGQMNIFLKIMEYFKPDGSLKPGVASILEPDESLRLRDNWNEACEADDVQIKVVAYASMASFSFLKSFLEDLQNYKYYSYIANYSSIIEDIIDIMGTEPNVGSLLVAMVDYIFEVLNEFEYQPFEGNASNEEVQHALRLIKKINDQLVLMDDLFIDANSQMGMGFSDGVEYKNFTRYSYIFKDSDMSNYRAKLKQPAVVHNLETMNLGLIINITERLSYGSSDDMNVLQDEESGEISMHDGGAFRFIANASGSRTFHVEGAAIKLYQKRNGGLTLLTCVDNSLTYEYIMDEEYLIILEDSETDNISYSFILSDDLYVATGNGISLTGAETCVSVFAVPQTGYYLFYSDSENLHIALNDDTDGEFYSYLHAGDRIKVYCYNTSASNLTCKIYVKSVESMNVGEETLIDASKKVMAFTNQYSYAVNYELSVMWDSVQSGSNKINIVNQDNSSIVSRTDNFGNSIKVWFKLQPNQTCYAIIPMEGAGITSCIEYDSEYIQWEINGIICTDRLVHVSRGRSYRVQAAYYLNGKRIKNVNGYGHDRENDNYYYYLNENTLTIKPQASINYDIFLWPHINTNCILRLCVVPNSDDIKLTVDNEGTSRVAITWQSECELDKLVIAVGEYTFTCANPNWGDKNISSWVPQQQYGYTYVVVTKALMIDTDGHCIDLTELDEIRDQLYFKQRICNLFGGGEGVTSSPYEISDPEHLDNIRHQHYEIYHPTDGYVDRITAYFKLTADIVWEGNWKPIETAFYGSLDGNGYSITNLKIQASAAAENYGLFCHVRFPGVVKNITFENCSINVPSSSSVYAGIVTGDDYNAKYEDVTINDLSIVCENDNSWIGSIAGSSSGDAYNCTVNNCSLESYGVVLGGMFGLLSGGGIRNSYCQGKLTLKKANDSKYTGEFYGKGSAAINGSSSDVKIDRQKEDSCLAEGTLITLADGRQVPVETLTGNEMLLVWNLQTGSFDTAPILFIDSDPRQSYQVINLSFSDGTSVKVIYEHGFWDYDLNQYVYLREDAAQYIGHWFNKQTTDTNGNFVSQRVQLTDVVVQYEYTAAYSPVTYGHLCYYVNGMLSMPGGIDGLFNLFDVDAETMSYDLALMQADIDEYGLFTYEEFVQLVPVTEEVFNAFNGQYLKVAIGKGKISIERLQELVERYQQFF